jgi:hypothetical protein
VARRELVITPWDSNEGEANVTTGKQRFIEILDDIKMGGGGRTTT